MHTPVQYAAPHILRATPEDADEISALLREAAEWLVARGEALWEPEMFTPESVRRTMAREEVHIARSEGEIIGTLILQWEDRKFWPEALPNEAAYIHKLAVRRSVAGQGIAGRMITWAKQTATAAGKRFLRLDCVPRPRLQAFYESQGFTVHSHRTVGQFSVVRYEMILSKGQ